MDIELKLLFRYVKNMGLRMGLSVFAKAELMKKPAFRMSGYPGVIHLRRSTSDIKVFREVFLFGAYSFKVDTLPRIIIDAGANVGLSSVYFAKRFPTATIYAIEPESNNFAVLQQNVAPYPNVKGLHTALWHSDAVLRITDLTENQWAFTVQECEKDAPDSLRAISIPSLMQQHSIERIDILKMDIEGTEHELFSGDYDCWLSRVSVIVIELHDWLKPGCSSVFFNAISRYNIKTAFHEGMLVIEITP